MADKKKPSLAEQIDFGGKYGKGSRSGSGIMSWIAGLLGGDSESDRPRRVPKPPSERPQLQEKRYKKGGKVRGCGIAKRGVKKCKMY